jgi:hypothetical protein
MRKGIKFKRVYHVHRADMRNLRLGGSPLPFSEEKFILAKNLNHAISIILRNEDPPLVDAFRINPDGSITFRTWCTTYHITFFNNEDISKEEY